MVLHVNGSKALSADGDINDAVGSRVGSCNGRSWLGVPHGLEGCSGNFAFFGVYKKGADFGFHGGGGDVFENASRVKDGALIDFGFVWVAAKIKMAPGATAGVGLPR
jgi:hypothetical protein